MRRVLGVDHPAYFTSIFNFAVCRGKLDRHADALLLYEECLQGRSRTLGLIHPDYLSCLSSLAICYGKLGRHNDAL